VLMLVVGVDCVYYGLKSCIFVGLRDLWITGSNTHISIFKKICIILNIPFFKENIRQFL
jgi:hypothetical protein